MFCFVLSCYGVDRLVLPYNYKIVIYMDVPYNAIMNIYSPKHGRIVIILLIATTLIYKIKDGSKPI